jgi:hypothetical protein
MERGEITQEGNYEELLQSGTAFEQLVNAHKDSKTTPDKSRERNMHNSVPTNNDTKGKQDGNLHR